MRAVEAVFEPDLLRAWLVARSVSRGLPAPVAEQGGFRVETGSEKELRRWVFPEFCDGVAAVGAAVTGPRQFIRLCAPGEVLRAALPARWQVQPMSYVMTAGPVTRASRRLPEGYRLHSRVEGAVTLVRILAADGQLAASGQAAEAEGVFVYDQIGTAPAHRRLGLGHVVMTTLHAHRRSPRSLELLVATEDGRALYATLGWRVLSPYASAVIPE